MYSSYQRITIRSTPRKGLPKGTLKTETGIAREGGITYLAILSLPRRPASNDLPAHLLCSYKTYECFVPMGPSKSSTTYTTSFPLHKIFDCSLARYYYSYPEQYVARSKSVKTSPCVARAKRTSGSTAIIATKSNMLVGNLVLSQDPLPQKSIREQKS